MKYIKIFTLACALCASPFYLSAAPRSNVRKETVPAGPSIRVLLEKNVRSALLEAKGDYAVVNISTGEILSSGATGKRFVVHAVPDGLRWGEEYPMLFKFLSFQRLQRLPFLSMGFNIKGLFRSIIVKIIR